MTILAFDPGAMTGYAVLAKTRPERSERNGRGLVLVAAGAFAYRQTITGGDIYDVIRAHTPTLIAVEDWENQGKRIDMHSTWPNRVIGQVEAYANLLGIHLSHVGASVWKPSFSARAHLLPPTPAKLPATHDRIARRVLHELGCWPEALANMPGETLRHAVDAAGLACWVAISRTLALQGPPLATTNSKPKRSAPPVAL